MAFIDRFEENAKKFADKMMIHDEANPKGITYGQLDQISGKVYAYLHAKGISKEDFVMICLPRGMQPIIAMCGVWKNGSAFVLVEDNYAPERIEFIKKDCGCKLVIDSSAWEEIQGCAYKAGHEPTDEHDAAFAVYTSGTTGNPKGVLHEYGNIDRMVTSVTMTSCEPLAKPDDRFALVAPLNFVASMLIITYGLNFAIEFFVVAYSVIKNPLAIGLFLIKNRITGTFLTPSYIRKMTVKPKGLRFCIIGSEPANEVYMDDLIIHNFYLMSESGFAVTHFLIDKKYEFTPVGKSEFGHEILLLDEEGRPVPDGEEGEICFEDKYVRGYIGLEEETKKAFRDGLYHSGDLARRDENGNLIICGRLSDMVKINGNRVEPAEIENITKKVLGIDWAAARIFDDGSRVYICAYYTDKKVKVDFESTRKEMEKYLPYYMLPSYFIHIDEVPLRPNGKMDRKALPAPNLDDYVDEYIAPRDEIETALCDAFAKVLGRDRIGIHDDFYQLGGDSMASMQVLVESKLPGLGASDIFRGHTPEKIAEIYKTTHLDDSGVSDEERNAEALKKQFPLTAEQAYMVDYQLYTPLSTMYNLFSMLKLDKEVIDLSQMAEALYKSAMAHPALLTVFSFNEDGEMMQSYHPELFTKPEVEKVTEAELEKIKADLVQPFKVFNSCLFRCRIFETEEAGYVFMDVHHTVFDGTSSKVFFGDALKAYAGMDLSVDHYYLILQQRQELQSKEIYSEAQAYFEKRYGTEFGHSKWHTRPKTDFQNRENRDEEIFAPIPVSVDAIEKLDPKFNLTPNSFFMTVALLATSYYNKKDRTLLSWIYNGRNNMSELGAVGLLFRNLPVGLVFKKKMSIADLYGTVVEQISKGMEYSCYPYVELTSNCVTGDFECVLYQDNLREVDDIPGLLGQVEVPHNRVASQNVLDLEILNSPEEGLTLMADYASSRYKAESMEKFRDIFCLFAQLLLHYAGREKKVSMRRIMHKAMKVRHDGRFLSKVWALKWMGRK